MTLVATIWFVICLCTVLCQKPPDNCIANWDQCGGKNWNKGTTCCLYTRYFCNKTDDYYSECVPFPLKPLPPAPQSDWCGKDGTTLNFFKIIRSSKCKFIRNWTNMVCCYKWFKLWSTKLCKSW